MPEPVVTPVLALRYLRELSADLLAAAVAGADGTPLAGPPELAAAASALVAGAAPVGDGADPAGPAAADDASRTYKTLQARTPDGLVVAAWSPAHTVVAVHTLHALAGLVRHDLLRILGDLAGAPDAPPEDVRPLVLGPDHPALRAALDAARNADSAPGAG